MKRVIGIIVLAMMVILPISVNAASGEYEIECSRPPEDQSKPWVMTCTISAKLNGASITRFNGELKMGKKIKNIKNVTASSPWTYTGQTGSFINFTSPTSMTGSFTIATIELNVEEVSAEEGTLTPADCSVYLIPCVDENGSYSCVNPVCKIVDGKYYGKDGNEVTQEVYEAECMNNPQTGSFVPYVVIIAGVALAVGVFTISRKNTKLYKI